MSFKSVLKGIGKVALKVAPYAAMAIPGVGIPLGMAIKGGIGAATGAMNGGGLKGALIGGGLGAAGGAAGALGGIGPSSGVLSKLGAGALGKATGTGLTGKIGSVLGGMATNAATSKLPPGAIDESGAFGQGTSGKSWKGVADAAMNAIPGAISSSTSSRGIGPSNTPSNTAVPRGQGTAPGFQFGTNNPNLADSILAGRQNAVINQPFRSGYDITQTNYNPSNPTNPGTHIIGHMPQIYSDFDPNNPNKRLQQQAGY
jgi:hypothetical protein